ncbi:hypothetical protein [Paenibacillus sp. J2TS4]|uniref:hypothetical protein n=1 Tax=Paenibacillus sp. J2TS4 TaxID=2807194 RepID=UPI001B2D9DF4|nr:hypothetical protein [Paenibacillus sp. J2TS4]GIP33447.1 hypothetical protein J2TS4_26570 [Paenibacillus sp. J2TS4]
MTLVAMKKQEFDSLDDDSLGWACMEPTLLQIRGKEMAVKTEAISRLNKGQQALCMFRVLYDHAKNSAVEYYTWISYLLDKPGYWSGVTGGLRFFGDSSMMHLLVETKEVLEASNHRRRVSISDATYKDLEQDNELQNAVSHLFARFLELAPHSLQMISTYIRAHPQDFVIIEN